MRPLLEFLFGPWGKLSDKYKSLEPEDLRKTICPECQNQEWEPKQSDLITVWNAFATASEQLNARRHTTNIFCTTINAGLIAGLCEQWANLRHGLLVDAIPFLTLCILGLSLNSVWISLLKTYSLVSFSKIEIMSQLEKLLEARIYSTQYGIVNMNGYKGFTETEIRLAFYGRTFSIIGFGIGIWKIYA